jgi:matrixin
MSEQLSAMIRSLLIVLAACIPTACGGGHPATPTGPTASVDTLNPITPLHGLPSTASASVVVSGPITDTLTGGIVGHLQQEVDRLPTLLPVSVPGYVTREAWIITTSPTVDLIPEARFDLAFYRQLARADFDGLQENLQPLWVLPQAPSFYMEVDGDKGLPRSVAERLEAVARRVVPALTGGRFQVTRWETGPAPRAPQRGWVMIERNDDLAGPDVPPNYVVCGRARVGAEAGQIWLHGDQVCRIEPVFAHELGHALGFFHVSRRGAMMYPYEVAQDSAADSPIEAERLAGAIAYARPRGNRDIDVDPTAVSLMPLRPLVMK